MTLKNKTLMVALLGATALTTAAALNVWAAEPSKKTQVNTAAASSPAANTPAAPMQTPDADMQVLLNTLASLKGKPIETLDAKEARKQPTPADAVKQELKDQKRPMPDTSDISTNTEHYVAGNGSKMKVELYTPKAAAAAAKQQHAALPVILYFHGGGWVIADTKTYESSAMALARKTGAMVASIEYRMAPEDKFPAAHEDAVAAYKWLQMNAQTYGGDPRRIALVGESAGGNLAVNTAIAARDQNLQMPVAVGAVYPIAQTSMETASYRQNANAKPLNKAMMAWFVKENAGPNMAEFMADPRIDLVNKANLRGLPPTTVITAGIDPLHDDGMMLADKLKAAGVNTMYRDYPGVTHEFFGTDAVVAKAGQAQDYLAGNLKQAFAMPVKTTPGAK